MSIVHVVMLSVGLIRVCVKVNTCSGSLCRRKERFGLFRNVRRHWSAETEENHEAPSTTITGLRADIWTGQQWNRSRSEARSGVRTRVGLPKSQQWSWRPDAVNNLQNTLYSPVTTYRPKPLKN